MHGLVGGLRCRNCARPAGWVVNDLRKRCREPSRQIGTVTSFHGLCPPASAGSSEESYAYLACCIAAAVVGGPQTIRQICHSAFTFLMFHASTAFAQPNEPAGEANLQLPICPRQFPGYDGPHLLLIGLALLCLRPAVRAGDYMQLKNLPVHRSMREISELIYRDLQNLRCHAGQVPDGAWAFIAVVIVAYFGWAGFRFPASLSA